MASLRDLYEPEELPTRPDNPRACARKCKHCGLVYGDHAEIFPIDMNAECFGVRVNFEPEATSDDERQR
jgi:hypothetical protein